MNHTSTTVLQEKHIQWLSVVAFMYFQQNQYNKALPLLEFLYEHYEFEFSINIQLIQCLHALNHVDKATAIINDGLTRNLSETHRSSLITLQKLGKLISTNGHLNKSLLCHEQ
jgi:thioredoxin-like negative regulator of GroEL